MGGLFGGGGSISMPDPFSAAAVKFRKEELVWQQNMAREEQVYQRGQAQEEREWQEDLEDGRALRTQKEEEERIRALRSEQQESLQESQGQVEAAIQDTDETYTDMWNSLSSGVQSTQRTAYSTGTTDKGNFADSFSKFIIGDRQ